MIHITVYQNSRKEITGFATRGHAGFAEEGQDIVCAAVSVLVINTINAIERFTSDQASLVTDEADGKIGYSLEEGCSREAQLLLKTMALGLHDMAMDEDYAEYMDLTFEEV